MPDKSLVAQIVNTVYVYLHPTGQVMIDAQIGLLCADHVYDMVVEEVFGDPRTPGSAVWEGLERQLHRRFKYG